MAQRVGTCASCGAQFRVPASFQADRVKCKQCSGVVELAPSGAASARPAAPAPQTAPPPPSKPTAATPRVTASVERARPVPKPTGEPVSTKRSASLRAAAQEAAERIRAAGPITNTAADRLRETALRPARRSRAPLLAGVGIAISLAAG